MQKNAGLNRKRVENHIEPITETLKSNSSIKQTESRNSLAVVPKKKILDSKPIPSQFLDYYKKIYAKLRTSIDYLLKCFQVPIDMNIVCVAFKSLYYSILPQFCKLPPCSQNELIREIFQSFSTVGEQHTTVADLTKKQKAKLFIIYVLSINGKRMHYRKILNVFHDLNNFLPDGADSDSNGFKYFRNLDRGSGICIGNDGYVTLTSYPPTELRSLTPVDENGQPFPSNKLPESTSNRSSVFQNSQVASMQTIKKRNPRSFATNESLSDTSSSPGDGTKNASHEASKRIAHGIRYLLEYFNSIPKSDSLRMVLYVLTEEKKFFLNSTSTLQRDMLNKCFFCFHAKNGNLISKSVAAQSSSVLKDEEKDVLFMVYLLYRESMFYGNLFEKCKEYKKELPSSALSLSDQRRYVLERKQFFKLEKNGYVQLHPLPVIEQLSNETANTTDCNDSALVDEKMRGNIKAESKAEEISANANLRSRKRSRSRKKRDPLTNFFGPEPVVPAKSVEDAPSTTSVSHPPRKSSIPPGFCNFEPSLGQPDLVHDSYKKYFNDLIDACLEELDKKWDKSKTETGNQPLVKKTKFFKADSADQTEMQFKDKGLNDGSSSNASSPNEDRTVNFFSFFLSQYKAGVSPDMLLTYLDSVASEEIQTYLKDCYAGDIISFFISHPAFFYLSPSGNVYLKRKQQ